MKNKKMSYFDDTDTLFIEFRESHVVGTKDLDEGTIPDLDGNGNFYYYYFGARQ